MLAQMFQWPMLAAAGLAIALQPTEGKAQQEIETVFAIPSQTLVFAAHDAGFFQKEA